MTTIEIDIPQIDEHFSEACVSARIHALMNDEWTDNKERTEVIDVTVHVARKGSDETLVNTVVKREQAPPKHERSHRVKHRYGDKSWAHGKLIEEMSQMKPVRIENSLTLDLESAVQMIVTIALCGLQDEPFMVKAVGCASCGFLYSDLNGEGSCPRCDSLASDLPVIENAV